MHEQRLLGNRVPQITDAEISTIAHGTANILFLFSLLTLVWGERSGGTGAQMRPVWRRTEER